MRLIPLDGKDHSRHPLKCNSCVCKFKKKYKVTGNNIFPHYSNAQIQTL